MMESTAQRSVTVAGHTKTDEIDYKMSAWLEGVAQGCSEETSLSLLSSALDTFVQQFPQETSDTSNSSLNYVEYQELETQRTTAFLVEVLEPDIDIGRSYTECAGQQPAELEPECSGSDQIENKDKESVSREIDQARVDQVQLISVPVVSSCYRESGVTNTVTWNKADAKVPCDVAEKDFKLSSARHKRKRKHSDDEEHRHDGPTCAKRARLEVHISAKKRTRHERHKSKRHSSAKRARKEEHSSAKRARHDNTNSYGSLDARLEQFYVCPKTNRLIPKGSKVVHSDKVRRSRFKKEKSLRVMATTRCLIQRALETGTYCCYKRCFLRKSFPYC